MLNFLIQHSPLLYFTQSLWRDEAYSILVAERPLTFIFNRLTFEPPIYYTFLHVWMKLFGTSEIATRSLSLVGFALATIVIIQWAEKLYKHHWLSWYLPLFFFLNPMLIYYAFEVRTYGWYIFFATLTFFAYEQKRWVLLTVASVLGFYTHSYMLFTIVAICLHWLVSHRTKLMRLRRVIREPMVRSMALIALALLPWIIRTVKASAQLKQSWYFPVDRNLVLSVLGNMFLGYEGTPWYLWPFTANLSLVLLGLFLLALTGKKTRTRASIFFTAVVVPLGLVVGVSFIKPLFVNRYLIPVTIAEIFLVVFAIERIKNTQLQKIFAFGAVLFVLCFNLWYPDKHKKSDIRTAIREVTALKTKDDVIYALSPLVLFESQYYSGDRSQVYLYNPNNSPFPWYVGESLVTQNQMKSEYPVYPVRAFLIGEDATYMIAYRTPLPARTLTQEKRP